MLVQISYSDTDTLGINFDELKGRATPHIQYYDWSEYVVVWRKDRLELYQNYVRDYASLSHTYPPVNLHLV